ncbi:thioesterase domain-containing protein [Streptomyces sp. NPDC093586]|uniref:thioesterase domain-containing protein n=1 Tax=Streptomyces sp. NPDC093586 TaxID=3366042 RepID=UPI0037F3BFA9
MTDAPWIPHYSLPVPPATSWQVLPFPHSDGSADSYRPLAARPAGLASAAGVRRPGRAERGRKSLFAAVHVLAGQVAETLAAVCEDDPFLLLGHSPGAVVTHGVARHLPDQRRTRRPPPGIPRPPGRNRRTSDPAEDGTKDADKPLTEFVRSPSGSSSAVPCTDPGVGPEPGVSDQRRCAHCRGYRCPPGGCWGRRILRRPGRRGRWRPSRRRDRGGASRRRVSRTLHGRVRGRSSSGSVRSGSSSGRVVPPSAVGFGALGP